MKKHDPRKRLRRLLTGATVEFQGIEGQLKYGHRRAIPMTRSMLDVLSGWPFRWRITVGIRSRLGESVRSSEVEFDVEQSCRINDLTEYVEERHQVMIMEQPAAWKVEAKLWKIECLG